MGARTLLRKLSGTYGNKYESRIRILEIYKKGASIRNEEDLELLEEYASTGMVHFGFNTDTDKAEASLTPQGKFVLHNMYWAKAN